MNANDYTISPGEGLNWILRTPTGEPVCTVMGRNDPDAELFAQLHALGYNLGYREGHRDSELQYNFVRELDAKTP